LNKLLFLLDNTFNNDIFIPLEEAIKYSTIIFFFFIRSELGGVNWEWL
jgi:hypothetical protein